MSISAGELHWREEYRRTSELIAHLSTDQLRAIQSIALEFTKLKSEEDFYSPMSREEMLADVDRSLLQARDGAFKPLEEVGTGLAEKYGFHSGRPIA